MQPQLGVVSVHPVQACASAKQALPLCVAVAAHFAFSSFLPFLLEFHNLFRVESMAARKTPRQCQQKSDLNCRQVILLGEWVLVELELG